MYDIKDIGKRITIYRKSLGMTQEELASKLNITAQAVSKWENGISLPDIGVLPELAGAFNTSMDKLFGNENTKSNSADSNQLIYPGFPEYISNTLKLVHTLNNVACYSEKEVSTTNEDTVIFKDSSSANLKTLKIVNKGTGDICFEYVDALPFTNIDFSKTEIHEVFEGIMTVSLEVSDSEFELNRSKDKKTYIDVTGSPLFIAALNISKTSEHLSIGYKAENNNSGNTNPANKVKIAFGSDFGDSINAQIVGMGKCNIEVPFEKGCVSINGSGKITFDTILNAECQINGSGDIKCNKAGNAKVIINGSGDFESCELSGKFKTVINGSGDIIAGTGELDTLEAKICGSGDIKAENISTRLANIAIDGSGDIIIGRVIEESVEKHSKMSSIKVLKRG